jgi:hypothetical protein
MLTHFLSPKPVVGNASIVGQAGAKGYFITPRDGQCFRVGTADFVGGVRVNLDGYLRGGGTNTLSGSVAFCFTKANSNNTDFMALKIDVIGGVSIRATLQLYTTGQTGVEHFVDTATAASNFTDRHFDHINLVWRKTGNTFRLGMVLIDKDATEPAEPEYLHATEVTLPYNFNLDTILSTTGALCFGKRYEAQGDVGISQSGFWIGALKSGLVWDQLGLHNDAGLLRIATDPHTGLTATQGAWSRLITFDGKNASGKSTLGCRALTADVDYLECINTGLRATYKQGASPTGTWEFREPHALPARFGQHMTSILAAPSAQLTRSGDLVVQGGHQGNQNSHFSFLVERRRPSDLMQIAPPVLISPAYWYIDSSNSNAVTRFNGDITPPVAHVTEGHTSIAVVINETAGYIDVAGGGHSDGYSNYPASGDTLRFCGFVARLCDELPVQTRPVPFLSNDVNGGTTYGVLVEHEDKSFLALRHGDTSAGRLGVVKVDGSLRLTDRIVTHSPAGIANYDAGIPTAMVKLDDRHALLVCQVRSQNGAGLNAGTWATFGVVIDLDAHGSSTEGWYGARTGDLLADEMGTVTWLRSSCLIDANAAVTQIDAANLDIAQLDQAYESMVGGLAVYRDWQTIHVAHFVAVQDDPTFNAGGAWKNRWADGWRQVCYTFDPTTRALTHVRTHDLTALAEQMGPAVSHDQPTYDEWQTQEPTFLYGEGNRVVIGLNVSGGADITAHANGGNEGRLGTHLSLGEIRDWHTATPTMTAYVNAVSAASRGGAVLRPYRIAGSTRCGLYIVDSGAAGSLTALFAARRESLDLTPYFTEEAVPTAEQIATQVWSNPERTITSGGLTQEEVREAMMLPRPGGIVPATSIDGNQAAILEAANAAAAASVASKSLLENEDVGLEKIVEDIGGIGGGGSPVYPKVIHPSRVWQYDDRSRARPVDIVTVNAGFTGRLAFEPPLNEGSAVATVTSVTLDDSASLVSELGPSGDYSQATFKVTAIPAGVYEVAMAYTSTDGDETPLAATLRVE